MTLVELVIAGEAERSQRTGIGNRLQKTDYSRPPMKAMVLTAGLGTRLRPLTFERAKPAIPLLGTPLVIRILERLLRDGVTDFRLNLHHLPESIERIFDEPAWNGMSVTFSHEPEILGTAGGLKANESFLDDRTFLMVNGDIVADFPLAEALSFHRDRRALATLILYPQPQPHRHYPIRIDSEGRLLNFKGTWPGGPPRPETYVFTGVHILEPAIFDFIPPKVFFEINDQVYPQALAMGKGVLGFPVDGYWNDLGDPGRYLAASRDLLLREDASPWIRLSPDANVESETHVGPFVVAGSGLVMEAGSSAHMAVIWDDVRLKRGSSVRNSIIGSGITVDAAVQNKIVTRYGEVEIA